MALPDWVRFSQINCSVEDVFSNKLSNLIVSYSLELRDIRQLGLVEIAGKVQEIYGPIIPSNDVSDALSRLPDVSSVCLKFYCKKIGRSMLFFAWEADSHTKLCILINGAVVYNQIRGYSAGEWLERFLHRLTISLEATCCGFASGAEYHYIYESLSPDHIADRFRDGSVFRISPPMIHMLSIDWIDEAEIRSLQKVYDPSALCRLEIDDHGLHILSRF
jgi:hypothetical protein